MGTLDGPIWSRCSIALTCPARSHFQRTQSKERWDQGWDERYRSRREMNKETKTGKRKQATNFKEAVCCSSAVLQGAEQRKNKGECPGYNWDPREVQQPFRPNSNGVGDRITTLRRMLIGAISYVARP